MTATCALTHVKQTFKRQLHIVLQLLDLGSLQVLPFAKALQMPVSLFLCAMKYQLKSSNIETFQVFLTCVL